MPILPAQEHDAGEPMERKKALATALASTLVLGSSMVAFAAVGGGRLLGFGDDSSQLGSFVANESTPVTAPPKTRTRDVYDEYLVDTPAAATSDASTASAASAVANPPAWPPTGALSGATSGGDDASDDTSRSPEASGRDRASPKPVKSPTTTVPRATTPTTDRGVEIPDDWPAGKPLPPIPEHCHEPHLEDNGVWNCQDGGDD
jgi:hypothetical protein